MRSSRSMRQSLVWGMGLIVGLAAPSSAQTTSDGVGVRDPQAVIIPDPLTLPAETQPFVDPGFGTTVERITGRSANGGYATHLYSQLQAFSSDNAYVLLIEDDAYVVRRLSDMQLLPVSLADVNDPRWHPSLAHTLVHFDSNEDATIRVQYTDVDTGAATTAFVFPPEYERVRVNQSFDEVSADGRWIAGMAAQSDGDQSIFALDLATGALSIHVTLSGLYSTVCAPDPIWGEVEPDWIGVSPLGNYLVVQWARDGTTRCSGLETFHIQTGDFAGRVSDGHQHGDLGVLPDGVSEFFMTYEFGHPSGQMYLGYRVLPGTDTAADPVYLQRIGWDSGGHISCRGPRGVCLVTSFYDSTNGWDALEGEIFLQYTDASVLRLTHHRSTSCGYWVQPRASLSRDGRFVIWASDWRQFSTDNSCGTAELGSGDVYVIGIGDLPAGTQPPPVLFADDFEDGDVSDWGIVRGYWTVVDGKLRGRSKRTADIVAPFAGCDRCAMRTSVRLLTAGGQMSVFNWYQDAQNHVELLLSDQDRAILRERIGGYVVRQSTTSLPIDPGVWYDVEMRFDGSRMSVSIAGQPLFDTVPAGSPFGGPGFRVRSATGLAVAGDVEFIEVRP